MFNAKTTAASLRVLSLLLLPLLACAMLQSIRSTPTAPAATITPTPISAAKAVRQTLAALTRIARRASPSPTKTLTPVTSILAQPSPGTVTPPPTFSPPAPQVISVSIPAPALARNLLGEALERELVVYLPASYAKSQKRYPVVYYLLDFGMSDAPAGLRPASIQKDIEAGFAKEMMIVVVSGVNSLGGSFYVNSPVTGNWDDFVTQNVVGYVDAHYRSISKPAARGIGGDYMGGSGALSLAMRHPDVFGAVYSLSPYLFDDHGLAESPLFSPPDMIDGFVDLQARELLISVDDAVSDMQNNAGDEQFALAYGAAFAPDPQVGPPYVDYPYRRQNGQLSRDESIWQRWAAGFGAIPNKIQLYKGNLLKLKSIAIDYGVNDSYRWLPRGCEYFSAQLTAAGIPNQSVSFPGDTQASLEQRIRAFMLPFFSEKLVFEN